MRIRTHAEWYDALTTLSAYRTVIENGCQTRIDGRLVDPSALIERVNELERAIKDYQERYVSGGPSQMR